MPAAIPIRFPTLLSSELQTEIHGFVARYATLEGLLNTPSSKPVVALVTQDEFTLDVVLHFQDEVYLVYDVT